MTIEITETKHNDLIVTITNDFGKNLGHFEDYPYEDNGASSVVEFLDILKDNKVDLAVKIIDNRPAKP